MPNTKVMVIDDSAAMRALFCDILDNAKGVQVCGTASNADEARTKLDEFRPDVLTLDVEMPGTSGLDFLAEIMEERPMPVIMLSSIAQAGSGTAAKALELGAVHCFPKPLHSSQEEFDATVAKLGDIVLRAASGDLGKAEETESSAPASPDFEPGDRIVALACGQEGLDAAKQMIAGMPSNCVPVVLAIDAPANDVELTFGSMRGSLDCELLDASDGALLEVGKVYLAFDPDSHVIVEPGSPARLRKVARDPVAGFRPSADLLLGSLARARCPAVAGLLLGKGADGAKGIQLFAGAGNPVFVQSPSEGASPDRYAAVKALGINAAELSDDMLGNWLLENTAAA